MIEPILFLCGVFVLCYFWALREIHKQLQEMPPIVEVPPAVNVFGGVARWIGPSQAGVVGAVTWRNFRRRQAIHAAEAEMRRQEGR